MFRIKYFLREYPSTLLRKTSSGKIIREIDGLRFIAIFPVLIQHFSERVIKYNDFEMGSGESLVSNILGRGGMGVYVFFVISGFVLAMPFAKSYLHGGRDVNLKSYFKRRITRLEPPYVIWMTIFALVLVFKGDYAFGETLRHLLASITYTHNIIYQDHSIINPVAWSLEVEIQFYILAPFLAWLFFKEQSSLSRIVRLNIAWLALMIVPYFLGFNQMPYKLTILGNLHYFILGFILCDLYLNYWTKDSKKSYLVDFIGAIGVYAIFWKSWSVEIADYMIFSAGTATIFWATFKGKIFNEIFTNTWIIAFGGMCYTIYLIHLPVAEAISKAMSLVTDWSSYTAFLTIGLGVFLPVVAIISVKAYQLLERPFMNSEFIVGFFKRNKVKV